MDKKKTELLDEEVAMVTGGAGGRPGKPATNGIKTGAGNVTNGIKNGVDNAANGIKNNVDNIQPK